MSRQLSAGLKFAIFILTTYFFISGIIYARNFLYPLTFAIMFSYLLYPVCSFLEKKGFPRVLAILTSIIGAIIILAVVIYIFYTQMSNLLQGFSSIKDQAIHNVEALQKNLQHWLGLKDNKIADFLKVTNRPLFQRAGERASKDLHHHHIDHPEHRCPARLCLPVHVLPDKIRLFHPEAHPKG